MLIGPHAATNRSIVGVGDGRHRGLAAAEKSLAAPCGERRHVALLHVLKTESIEHDHNRTLLRPLGEGGTGEKRRARSKKLPTRKQRSSHRVLLGTSDVVCGADYVASKSCLGKLRNDDKRRSFESGNGLSRPDRDQLRNWALSFCTPDELIRLRTNHQI